MELAMTSVICITVVMITAICVFGIYVVRRGPLRSWKKASFEAIFSHVASTPRDGRITLITPRGRAGAKNVKIDLMEDLDTNEICVKMTGKFDRYDFQDCI